MYTRSSSASRSLPLRLSSSSLQLIAVAIASAVACSWCCRVDRCFFWCCHPSPLSPATPSSPLWLETHCRNLTLPRQPWPCSVKGRRPRGPPAWHAQAAAALLHRALAATRPSSSAHAGGRGSALDCTTVAGILHKALWRGGERRRGGEHRHAQPQSRIVRGDAAKRRGGGLVDASRGVLALMGRLLAAR